MIRKFEIVKGQRTYTVPISAGMEYCVSASGAFTVEVMDGNADVWAAVIDIGHVTLPKFSKDCQLRIVGRDWSSFTVHVSDNRLKGE